jgi:hypothetical protein
MRPSLVVVITLVSALAQNHQPVSKSKPVARLSDSFSKAGIKALFAMQRYRSRDDKAADDKAEEALDEARAEHNPDNQAEAQMFSNLVTLSINHSIVLLRRETELAKAEATGDSSGVNDPLTEENRCVGMLEAAFRKRTTTKLPKECGEQQKQ